MPRQSFRAALRRLKSVPGPISTEMGRPREVRFPPDSDQTADVTGGPFANKRLMHRSNQNPYSITSSATASDDLALRRHHWTLGNGPKLDREFMRQTSSFWNPRRLSTNRRGRPM